MDKERLSKAERSGGGCVRRLKNDISVRPTSV
jgi:hypothetical protein